MTLIEAIVSVAIFGIVSGSLYTIITLGVQLVRDDQARLDALAIAQAKMEALRNVPYDDIGTVGGIPSGAFEQSESETHNNTVYTIETDIRYVDDAFDGTTPTDTVSTDYKRIRIEVSWEGQYVSEPVVLVSTIAPNGLESSSGGGTLWLEVYTADSMPISAATVHITNSLVSPSVDITSATDSDGRYLVYGATASTQGYHVEISKSGYSSSQTYTVDVVSNPNPDPSDQTVVDGAVTTKLFYIDQVSDMTIHMEDLTTATPTANLDVRIVGAKRIGTASDGSDIPKYDQTLTTDANGDITLTDIEYDTYSMTFDDATTGYDLAGTPTSIPHVLAPNASDTVTLQTATDSANSFLVTVTNAEGQRLEAASVRLYTANLSADVTQQTNVYGQAFFPSLSADTYLVDVTLAGYEPYQSEFVISNDVQETIPLTVTP